MKLAARIAVGVLAVVAVAAVGFGALYASRIQTANSIEKLTDYDDYNLYRMQVRYDYDLDKMIANTTADNQSFIDAAVKQALPLLPVSIKAPTFGCSAFHIQETGGDHLMGRNYDFKRDTSAMLVCTAPKDGYKSIAFAALDNLGVNQADASTKAKIASLLAPFACLDGINEKGVSIAVLTLDSEPTKQDTASRCWLPLWPSAWCWTAPPQPPRPWSCCSSTICLPPAAATTTFTSPMPPVTAA